MLLLGQLQLGLLVLKLLGQVLLLKPHLLIVELSSLEPCLELSDLRVKLLLDQLQLLVLRLLQELDLGLVLICVTVYPCLSRGQLFL